MSYKKVFVPRLMDADNFNPQNSNAQNMLVRWSDDGLLVSTFFYNAPRQEVAGRSNVKLIKLWRWRFWRLSAWLAYQKNIDAIFYPGADVSDDLAWRFRDRTGRRVPIIATLEGLVGNAARETEYSDWSGHPVYCQHVNAEVLARIDRLYERADRIIAISPFLAKMGKKRYGDKFSVLPLGLDSALFFSDDTEKNERTTVIGAGRLYANKRPEIFIELASKFPHADFVWYGWGELLEPLRNRVNELNLSNLQFPGAVRPEKIADAMRSAHLFILPSHSEGTPKVIQEAAACGLAVICYGFYETPHVIDGENGFVVWDDEQLSGRVEQLLLDKALAERMGKYGAKMAKEWAWNMVAPLWETEVIHRIC